MKKIVYKYQISKFRRFTTGLLFAGITMIALILCIVNISDPSVGKTEVILPFIIAIASIIMGSFSMFRDNEITKDKYNMN